MLMNISYHANGLKPLVRAVNLKAFAYEVFAGPVRTGHRTIDDCYTRCLGGIGILKIPACDEWNIQSAEIFRADDRVVRAILAHRRIRRVGMPLDDHAASARTWI